MKCSEEKTSVAARNFVILGEELSRRKRYAAAEQLYQRALTLVERALGTSHPMAAEVLDCYAELFLKTGRSIEGNALKSRAEAIWEAYRPRFCRTRKEGQPSSFCSQEQEGSD